MSVYGLTSCQKQAVAKSNAPLAQSKILWTIAHPSGVGGWEIWIANTDGTGMKQLQITLPSPSMTIGPSASVTADGQYVLFTASSPGTPQQVFIYQVAIDGTGLKKVLDLTSLNVQEVQSVHPF